MLKITLRAVLKVSEPICRVKPGKSSKKIKKCVDGKWCYESPNQTQDIKARIMSPKKKLENRVGKDY